MQNFRSTGLFKFIDKRLYKRFMRLIPHGIKYRVISKWHTKQPPFKFVKKGNSIIQIGASGRLCELGRSQPLIFSTLVGNGGMAHVFEVLPENVEGINEYVTKHGITNVKCHNIGIWKEQGKIEFAAPYRMATGSLIKEVRPEMKNKFTTSRIFNVDSIDNLVRLNDIQRVDLINITINGAEPEAIEGAEETITKHKPVICMPYPDGNYGKVIKDLKNHGYKIYIGHMRLYFISGKFKILWAYINK